jgi:hypothetical protein
MARRRKVKLSQILSKGNHVWHIRQDPKENVGHLCVTCMCVYDLQTEEQSTYRHCTWQPGKSDPAVLWLFLYDRKNGKIEPVNVRESEACPRAPSS